MLHYDEAEQVRPYHTYLSFVSVDQSVTGLFLVFRFARGNLWISFFFLAPRFARGKWWTRVLLSHSLRSMHLLDWSLLLSLSLHSRQLMYRCLIFCLSHRVIGGQVSQHSLSLCSGQLVNWSLLVSLLLRSRQFVDRFSSSDLR